MLNKPSPLPLNDDADTVVFILNPKFGEIDAVAEPLAILFDTNASSVKAERGISNKPLPLPVNIDADIEYSKKAGALTNKPVFGAIDAVAEPLAIRFDTKDCILSADNGILNNPSPLPLKYPLPDGIFILPLTNKLPVKVEPLNDDSTLNPNSGETDAVIEPLANLVAFGKLNKFEPSP